MCCIPHTSVETWCIPNLYCILCFSYFFPCKSCIHVYLLLLLSVVKRICLDRFRYEYNLCACDGMKFQCVFVFSIQSDDFCKYYVHNFMCVHPHTQSSSTKGSLMMVLPISHVLVCNGVCMILYLTWKIYV